VLRARACWTLQQFSAVIGDIGAEAASATVQKLLERMRDPALPVRVMAACALGVFVDNADIKPQLEPLIGELLHAFLGDDGRGRVRRADSLDAAHRAGV
jgi:HEAT repeat protein